MIQSELELQNIELVLDISKLKLEISKLNGKILQLQSFFNIEKVRAEKSELNFNQEKEAHIKSMNTYLDFVRLFIEKDNELKKLKQDITTNHAV